MPANWPKNGLFLIRAENGKYWAETLPARILEDFDAMPDETLAGDFADALVSLEKQVADSRKKSIVEICKKVVHEKAQTN